MKILHTVEFYEPRKGGAEEVVRQLSERLVKMGHEVTVATTSDPDRVPGKINGVLVLSFDLRGNMALGIKGEDAEIERYKRLLHDDFDLILNYAAQNWPTDLTLDELRTIKAKKVLVPCGYSGLNSKKYNDYFKRLPEYLVQYDGLVYMSENYQDKKFGDEHGLKDKVEIIVNGADQDEVEGCLYDFRKKHKIKTKYLAINVSNHYLGKGHKFVLKAFRMMRRRDTTLVILGQSRVSSGWRRWVHWLSDFVRCKMYSIFFRNIKLVDGSSREVVLGAYKAGDVFLFGSELECAPLVTYEAMASKTVFIARPVGNIPDHEDYVKIVKTPAQMAQVANNVLDSDEARAMITQKAFDYFKKYHTWSKIVSAYEKLYNSVLK